MLLDRDSRLGHSFWRLGNRPGVYTNCFVADFHPIELIGVVCPLHALDS